MNIAGEASTRNIFKNDSNYIGALLASWFLWAMAALTLREGSLSGPDPMTISEFLIVAVSLFLGSVGVFRVLAFPYAVLEGGRLTVVNPLRKYSFDVESVVEIVYSDRRTPIILLQDGRKIRVPGLHQSEIDLMSGGSREVKRLEGTLEALTIEEPGVPGFSIKTSPMGIGTALLLGGWFVYFISLFV